MKKAVLTVGCGACVLVGALLIWKLVLPYAPIHLGTSDRAAVRKATKNMFITNRRLSL